MRALAGVFASIEDAAKAEERLLTVLPKKRVRMLNEHNLQSQLRSMPVAEVMPAVGGRMGAVLGGAIGILLGLLIAGIGEITPLGIVLAVLLGGVIGTAGWFLGDRLDRASTVGIPVDELFVYEDAVRRGRTVVIAFARDPDHEPAVKDILDESGAESLDAARRLWLESLSDGEDAAYNAAEGPPDDESFRRGFEAALDPELRGKGIAESARIVGREPDAAFSRGFEHGRSHVDRILEACGGSRR